MNGESGLPLAPHVGAALVVLAREDFALLRVMNARGTYRIAIQTALRRCHANIGTVKMEVSKVVVESQSRGLFEDQYEFVESLNLCRPAKGPSMDTLRGGACVTPVFPILRHAPAPQYPPIRVTFVELRNSPAELRDPSGGKVDVLMGEYDQVVRARADRVVVCPSSRSEITLKENLVLVRCS